MNIVERAKAILLKPDREWRVIEHESADPKHLFTNYIGVIALIPAFAGFVSSTFIGVETPAGTVRLSILAGLICAVYGYVLTLVIVYIAAFATDWLAPRFGGQKNFDNALRLSVYCNTPYCLASVFLLVPFLKFLIVLGLYGLYLFYRGAPILMKCPRNRAALYAAAVFAIVFIVALPLGSVQTLFWL